MISNTDEILEDYNEYLLLERNLSPNTIQSYGHDVKHLIDFSDMVGKRYLDLTYEDLEHLLAYLVDLGLGNKSLRRTISGLKSFYRFLELEELVTDNPTELLDGPRVSRDLPEVLTVEEIDALIAAIDLSTPHGVRNAAIIELLYSCGLRVSEACEMTFSSLFLEERYIRVVGKGSKERLVPMSESVAERIYEYLPIRQSITPKPAYLHHLFLSRVKTAISRQMVFMVIKDLAKQIDLQKEISPHTLRHSFATHLLEGGAHLQAIRDMLGHADISTTEIYTHIDRNSLREEILHCHPRNK